MHLISMQCTRVLFLISLTSKKLQYSSKLMVFSFLVVHVSMRGRKKFDNYFNDEINDMNDVNDML